MHVLQGAKAPVTVLVADITVAVRCSQPYSNPLHCQLAKLIADVIMSMDTRTFQLKMATGGRSTQVQS